MSVEQEHGVQGREGLAGAISNAFVQMFKERGGIGPQQCRTYLHDDLIIVLLRGGYSRMEGTLFEDGKWLDVQTMRHLFHDSMEGRLTEVIERLTGRQVAACMSASHQQPDLQIEAFVLGGGTVPERSPDLPD